MNAALWVGTLGASILIVTVFLTAYLDQQHRKRITDLERQVRQLNIERATWRYSETEWNEE